MWHRKTHGFVAHYWQRQNDRPGFLTLGPGLFCRCSWDPYKGTLRFQKEGKVAFPVCSRYCCGSRWALGAWPWGGGSKWNLQRQIFCSSHTAAHIWSCPLQASWVPLKPDALWKEQGSPSPFLPCLSWAIQGVCFLQTGTGATLSPDAWPRLLWPTLALRAQAYGSSHFSDRGTHTGTLTLSDRNQSFSLGRVKSCLVLAPKGHQKDCGCGLVGLASAYSFHFIFPPHVSCSESEPYLVIVSILWGSWVFQISGERMGIYFQPNSYSYPSISQPGVPIRDDPPPPPSWEMDWVLWNNFPDDPSYGKVWGTVFYRSFLTLKTRVTLVSAPCTNKLLGPWRVYALQSSFHISLWFSPKWGATRWSQGSDSGSSPTSLQRNDGPWLTPRVPDTFVQVHVLPTVRPTALHLCQVQLPFVTPTQSYEAVAVCVPRESDGRVVAEVTNNLSFHADTGNLEATFLFIFKLEMAHGGNPLRDGQSDYWPAASE